jgi:magnesium-transporting ATPase (P-type)
MAGGWSFGMPLPSDSFVYIKGTTMTFAGIVVAQVGNVLACRTTKQSVFRTSVAANKWILLGVVSQFSILCFLVYVPFLQRLFGTTALNVADWAFLALLPMMVIVAEEIRKFFARRLSKTA